MIFLKGLACETSKLKASFKISFILVNNVQQSNAMEKMAYDLHGILTFSAAPSQLNLTATSSE